MQTDEPSWLDRSYGEDHHALDLNSAYRSIWSQSLIVYLSLVLGIRGKLLDFGGGCGLFCRLLRDIGIDAYVFDKYRENIYAQEFKGGFPAPYAIVTAFEVFEHFPCPANDIIPLFECEPELLVVGTNRYYQQGPEWYYLIPHTGRHVFFWSKDSHQWVAHKYGYHAFSLGDRITIYCKNRPSFVRRQFLRLMSVGTKMVQVVIPVLPRSGIKADEKLLKCSEK